MDQPRFKVTVSRVNQPAHQMADVSMTLPGDLLGNIIRALVDAPDKWASLMTDDGFFSFDAETWKSVTISRVDEE